jgi:hypothetical protein
MAPTTTISVPIPEGVTAEAVVKILHDHDAYIKITCPQLVSYKLVSGDASTNEPCVYSVTDKKPIGQTTYSLTLTNVPDGLDNLVNAKAPIGALTINGKWRVADGKLTEEVDIDANMVMKKMVKGGVEKSHPEHLAEFVKRAVPTPA